MPGGKGLALLLSACPTALSLTPQCVPLSAFNLCPPTHVSPLSPTNHHSQANDAGRHQASSKEKISLLCGAQKVCTMRVFGPLPRGSVSCPGERLERGGRLLHGEPVCGRGASSLLASSHPGRLVRSMLLPPGRSLHFSMALFWSRSVACSVCHAFVYPAMHALPLILPPILLPRHLKLKTTQSVPLPCLHVGVP